MARGRIGLAGPRPGRRRERRRAGARRWPAATPAFSWVFILLAVASFVAFVASLALVAAQARASVDAAAFSWPSSALSFTAAILVLITVAASLLSALAVPLLLLATLIVLPGAAAQPWRPFAGFRVFATAPLRAILLAVLTLVVVGLLWVVALLLGLLVTGFFGAGFTWLVFGCGRRPARRGMDRARGTRERDAELTVSGRPGAG